MRNCETRQERSYQSDCGVARALRQMTFCKTGNEKSGEVKPENLAQPSHLRQPARLWEPGEDDAKNGHRGQ